VEASVSLKKVGKLFDGQSVLAGLSFGIERGSIMAVVGLNDAGKSTLLKVLAGVSRPEYGNVYINGIDAQLRPNEIKLLVGYLPQSPNFDCQLTLRENYLFHGALYHLTNSVIKSQIAKLTRTLDMVDMLDYFPDELSRGYLKRAMLVRTLLHDPPVLFLDEPTSSLDIRGKYLVWDLFENLRGSKTIVYATQSLEEAEHVHDRISILHHGKIVLEGSLAAFGAVILGLVLGITFFMWFQSVGLDVSHLSASTMPVRERVFLDFQFFEIMSSVCIVVVLMIFVAWWPVKKISGLDPTMALRGRGIT